MKYRKKPVIVEAVEYEFAPTEVGGKYKISVSQAIKIDEIQKFTNGSVKVEYGIESSEDEGGYPENTRLTIPTLEGEMLVSKGDYIIKGVNGEFYPCKPDIFHKIYEKIEE